MLSSSDTLAIETHFSCLTCAFFFFLNFFNSCLDFTSKNSPPLRRLKCISVANVSLNKHCERPHSQHKPLKLRFWHNDVRHNLLFNYYNLLFLIFLCNFPCFSMLLMFCRSNLAPVMVRY